MFSVIVPCRNTQEAEKCYAGIRAMIGSRNVETIVLPDASLDHTWTIIKTGKILPSHKRDIGIKKTRSESKYIAFIDADAFPRKDWLKRAEHYFKTEDIVAVCGPGLLPPGSGFLEKAADFVLRKLPYSYRVKAAPRMFVDDYPTFNLIVKKKWLKKVGGFECEYLTGEDTLLCKKLVDAGGKILYAPDVVVYHERRPLFRPFLKQISTYGRHRGFFCKKFPSTSKKMVYLISPIGVLCLISALLWWAFLALL